MKQMTQLQRVRFLAKRARKRFGTCRPTVVKPAVQQVMENPNYKPTDDVKRVVTVVFGPTVAFKKDLQ